MPNLQQQQYDTGYTLTSLFAQDADDKKDESHDNQQIRFWSTVTKQRIHDDATNTQFWIVYKYQKLVTIVPRAINYQLTRISGGVKK